LLIIKIFIQESFFFGWNLKGWWSNVLGNSCVSKNVVN
jgi:hypothetical protein